MRGLGFVNKLERFIVLAIPVFFLVGAAVDIYAKIWFPLFFNIIGFLVSLATFKLRKTKLRISFSLQLFVLLFIWFSFYLGEIRNFYHVFWWWDFLLHTVAGAILGLLAFNIFYLVNKEKSLDFKLSPAFLMLFSISFALLLGVLWEFFEFFMDQSFGFNMQKSGLFDTMGDLAATLFGAIVVNLVTYFYLMIDRKKFRRFFGNNFIKLKSELQLE